jgi:hypothetical protein
MKMSLLARVRSEKGVSTAQTCWVSDCGSNLRVQAKTRAEAISQLNNEISKFIEELGRSYIESHSASSDTINCPQASVHVPIDTWHCKAAKTVCPLQGQIRISNPQTFLSSCPLNEKLKTGILKAIAQGKYKGFHHMPGRYKCVLCENDKINYNYHYPWELTFLADHCNIEEIWSNTRRASQIIVNDFPLSALSGALCADCFRKIAKLFPEIRLEEYETIVYDYHRS